jgi:hypothetical protein
MGSDKKVLVVTPPSSLYSASIRQRAITVRAIDRIRSIQDPRYVL